MKLFSKLRRIKLNIHTKRQLRGAGSMGKWTGVFGNIDVIYPQNLRVGEHCSFNHGVYINAFNPITLGDDVTVSVRASLISTGIDYKAWASGNKCHEVNDGISINSHVWIGAGAYIVGNVKITGEYVVIASGAVLTSDVHESYCILAGCPAKIIKYIDN